MKERIILAPGLNGAELTQSLALHGVNCIGLRICGAAELARLALMRSGVSIPEDFISAKEEVGMIAEAVAGEPYFGKASYSDLQEIAAAVRRMRSLIASGAEALEVEHNLTQGIFREKNLALFEIYRKYIDLLSRRNSVDAISLIRMAAEQSRVIDAELLTLREYPLNPLETLLLDRISGRSAAEIGIHVLFGVEEGAVHIDSIKNCYGAPNEVESILEEIYTGKRMDQCTVAVTDGITYGQLFFDYALRYDIPVTFGCGIPIVNSNPARLLAAYNQWITGGFFGAAALKEMLLSKAFHRAKLLDQFPERDERFRWSSFLDVLGELRLTNDRETNARRVEDFKKAANEEAALVEIASKDHEKVQRKLSFLPCLDVMAKELSLPAEEFISKYANIRKRSDTNADRLVMMLDIAASRAIYEELQVIRNSGAGQDVTDVIPNVLKRNVCAQRSEAGKLHVTGIEGAFAAMRENLYIAGLSASNFPGSPRENYLLLDSDLKLFGPGAEALTSGGRILRKRKQLLTLVRLASALGASVSVSYAGLNVSELKKNNPSSLVFELFREAHGGAAGSGELEKFIRTVDYFEPAVSVSRLVGDAYTKGQKIQAGIPADAQGTPIPWDLEDFWSPTALDTFFGCPRRFMLRFILGIPEPEDYDPFEIISAMDTGTLAHSLMEALGRESMDADTFREKSKAYFDRFLRSHPPLIPENVSAVREQFLDMMDTAYLMDPHREIVLEEEDIYCTHESGVKIHGFPDRVEKLDDGSCLIVDYKSGRKVKHVQDDIATCLQVIVYAYLMEHKGFRVSGGEYRYIRLGKTVTCRFDEEIKRQLSECLTQFKDCMESGSFPAAKASEDGSDPCEYCKFQSICGNAPEVDDTEEGGTDE